MQPRMWFALLATRVHFFSLTPVVIHRSFLAGLIFPSVLIMGLFHPRCRTPHFSLLNLVRFLLTQSRFTRSIGVEVLPFAFSATSSNLVSSADLPGVQLWRYQDYC